MGVSKVGAILALSGEAEYKRAISAVNAAQRELKSEMKLVTEEFSGQANTMEALTKKYENLEKQRENQSNKVEIYTKAVADSTKKEELAAEAVEKAEKQYKEAAEQLEKLNDSTESSAEEVEKQKQAVAEAKEQLELSNRAYIEAEKENNNWQNSLNNSKTELEKIEKELGETEKYLDEAKESTDQTAKSIDEFGKEVKDAENEVDVFGDVLKATLASEVIITGAKKLCSAIGEIADYSVESGEKFEEAMSIVAATMGIANSEVEDATGSYKILNAAAREAGETTKYSATESAEALNYLALAGYDAEKAAAVLPDVLNLAAAGAMDLAYSSDLVTDSMAALEIESKNLTNFTDQMAVTAQKSNTSISQLGEAILQIGGTAKMLAGGTVELNTELGILADNGIKGAEGGTMLRNVLKNLTSPTDKASAAMKEYGIRVYDAEGNMRPLNETLGDLNDALSTLSDEERAQVMNKIFDSRNLKGAEALISNCGERFDELSSYISNADGAAQAMAETMSNNLAGDMKILESTAESTGITLYEKFSQSFRKITQSASTELGNVNKSLQSGTLGKSVDELAEKFENAAESALDFGADALPVVIDGLSFLLDHGDGIVATLAGIGTGMAAFKTASAISDTVDKFTDFKNTLEKTKSAQAALNAVTNANPYVVLAAAIAGVTTAIVAYTAVSGIAETEAGKLNKEVRNAIDSNKEFNSSISDSLTTLNENRVAQEQNTSTIKRLGSELMNLNSKEKLTNEEKNRMCSVVAQLNNLMPELNLSIDEQTGYLAQSSEEVGNLVEKYTELAKAQYYQDEITEIIQKQCEAEDELTELLELREKAVIAISAAEDELNEYLKENSLSLEELNERISDGSAKGSGYVYAVTVSQAALQELDAQIEETNKSLDIWGDKYTETSEKISNHSPIDDTADAIENLADTSADAAETLSQQAENMVESFNDMGDSIRESVGESINIFEEYEKQTEISGESIINNMESQIEGMQSWGDNLSALAGRADENGMLISEGLLSHLVDLGPSGAAYVQAFVNMTDEELRNANELWEEAVTLPDTIADKFVETGEQMAAGLKAGIEENIPDVVKTMKKGTDDILESANVTAEIKSPSKRTTQTGEYMMEGLSKGITNKKATVVSDMKKAATEVLDAAKGVLSQTQGNWIGQQFSTGLALGIRAGKSEVINAAIEVAQAAVTSAKSTLKINSPSKVTEEMGGYYMDGWIQGITARTENLKDAVRGALETSLIQEVNQSGNGDTSVNGATALSTEKSVAGGINIYIQPQQMTNDELDRAFEYVNQRFGTAL